jgi:uncharacterized protein YcfL
MKFLSSVFIVIVLFYLSGCRSENTEPVPVDGVVFAYDTLELRYQQIADLAIDLMANISVDPGIKVNQLQELIDRQPVVSLDFRKPHTTQADVSRFINYQQKIDNGLREIFRQLDAAPKWRAAPLILEIKNKYVLLKDSIASAKTKFNAVVKESHLGLQIPPDTVHQK